MKSNFYISAAFLLLFFSSPAFSAEVNCVKCHKKIAKNAVVHPALGMGCVSCHSALDGRTRPHKKTNTLKHGLSSEQPALCYGCHDKSLFTKKNVHPAVDMGCTGCHNPHSSKKANLLVSSLPALCMTCHDKANFSKKIPHTPVASGKCLTCHFPHASDEMALLRKGPAEVCVPCHKDVTHGQHTPAMAFRTVQDPTRPDKPLYCGSCHNPHGSDSPLLFRFNVKEPRELCLHCHKM